LRQEVAAANTNRTARMLPMPARALTLTLITDPPVLDGDVTHIAVMPLIRAAPALFSRPTLTSTTPLAARKAR
jgi:hypothetical protein